MEKFSGFLTVSEVADSKLLQKSRGISAAPVMASNLTKRDIVLSIYDKTGFPQKEVREVVQLTLDTIADALAQGRNVELRNFGVFEIQIRKSRIGRNPNKPEKDVVIPTRAVIKFKAGKELKAELRDLDIDRLQQSS
ncbi:MAG: HU family DNA-binding protein [Opitutales bacterium]